MAQSHVHAEANGATGVTSIALTGFAAQVGDVVLLGILVGDGGAVTMGDDGLGTTYTEINNQTAWDGAVQHRTYRGTIGSAGTCAPNYSKGGAATRCAITCQASRGTTVTGVQANTATGTGTAADGGNVTTSDNAYFAAFLSRQSIASVTAGTGYGNLVTNAAGRIGAESKLVTGGTTDNGDFTLGSSITWAASTVAVPEAAGGSTGSGTPSAQSATVSGAGLGKSIGSGTPAAQSATASGAGLGKSIGSGTPASQDASVSGAGATKWLLAGAPAAQDATVSGAGLGKSIGTGAPAADASTVSGSGSISGGDGVGLLSAQSSQVSGEGLGKSIGSGTPASQDASVSGSGTSRWLGIGTPQAQAASVTGTGLARWLGTGSLAAQSATVSGSGLGKSIGTVALWAASARR